MLLMSPALAQAAPLAAEPTADYLVVFDHEYAEGSGLKATECPDKDNLLEVSFVLQSEGSGKTVRLSLQKTSDSSAERDEEAILESITLETQKGSHAHSFRFPAYDGNIYLLAESGNGGRQLAGFDQVQTYSVGSSCAIMQDESLAEPPSKDTTSEPVFGVPFGVVIGTVIVLVFLVLLVRALLPNRRS